MGGLPLLEHEDWPKIVSRLLLSALNYAEALAPLRRGRGRDRRHGPKRCLD